MRVTMKQFWESVASGDPTLAQMIFYPDPATISESEIPEVLSLLPDIEKKDILDLGAGIGQVLYHVITCLHVCIFVVIFWIGLY